MNGSHCIRFWPCLRQRGVSDAVAAQARLSLMLCWTPISGKVSGAEDPYLTTVQRLGLAGEDTNNKKPLIES